MLLLHLLPHLQTQALPRLVLFRDLPYLSFLDLSGPQVTTSSPWCEVHDHDNTTSTSPSWFGAGTGSVIKLV